jgi:hypothetical protein
MQHFKKIRINRAFPTFSTACATRNAPERTWRLVEFGRNEDCNRRNSGGRKERAAITS